MVQQRFIEEIKTEMNVIENKENFKGGFLKS